MGCFILLSSYFVYKPTANGICAKNIVKELIKQGNIVHVICYKQELHDHDLLINGLYIHEIIASSDSQDNTKIMNRFNTISSCFYPKYNNSIVDGYMQEIESIVENEKTDCLIAMYFPIETVIAACKAKLKDPDLKIVLYELDSVGDGLSYDSFLRKLNVLSFERCNKRTYRVADKIIVMESHREYWQRVFGSRFMNKVQFADLPVLVKRDSYVRKYRNNVVQFLYAGLLDGSYRSPEYLLKCILLLKDRLEIQLDFYSKGNCMGLLEEASKQFDGIVLHGYVAEQELNVAIEETDILVSIGNSDSNSLPSKLITYVSYCKPIIHFSTNDSDICIPYLHRYPLSLVINDRSDIEENIDKMIDFLNKIHHETISYEKVEKVFEMNTPNYSIKLINDRT